MDKAELLKRRLPEDDVPIEGVGTVRVRGLSRAEAVHVQLAGDPLERDRRVLAQGLVDPDFMLPFPVLHSIGDKPCGKCAPVGQWQECAPAGELEPVSERITQLSGLADRAAVEVNRELEANPAEEFRDVPGGEAR
jgi:hypothetical protein